jgi:hypothetical protein
LFKEDTSIGGGRCTRPYMYTIYNIRMKKGVIKSFSGTDRLFFAVLMKNKALDNFFIIRLIWNLKFREGSK